MEINFFFVKSQIKSVDKLSQSYVAIQKYTKTHKCPKYSENAKKKFIEKSSWFNRDSGQSWALNNVRLCRNIKSRSPESVFNVKIYF